MNRTPLRNLLKLKLFSGGSEAPTEELTATGNPAMFTTDVIKPLKSLVVPFESESGVSGLTAYRTGKNLWASENGVLSNTFIKKGLAFSFSCDLTDYRIDIQIFDKIGSMIDYWILNRETETRKYKDLSAPQDIYSIKAVVNSTGQPITSGLNIMLGIYNGVEYTHEYVPYTGASFPVVFPDGQTIYGGSLDLVSGILTVTAPESKTIQLDPVTIQTLIGENNVWTDTNGTNTVKYLKKVST